MKTLSAEVSKSTSEGSPSFLNPPSVERLAIERNLTWIILVMSNPRTSFYRPNLCLYHRIPDSLTLVRPKKLLSRDLRMQLYCLTTV
ncbi:unnamed protein product [Hymenolepis diminuta]|uniref:Uncharacterized protein n=1 Tax=Hymenolepis diminuta TaxID=6216 RepID=A0A564ZEC1_HYMDI|nr:unnamed protein product [Hymenolepis diminuta]